MKDEIRDEVRLFFQDDKDLSDFEFEKKVILLRDKLMNSGRMEGLLEDLIISIYEEG